MFTGIVEEVGRIKTVSQKGQAMMITVEARRIIEDIHLGDSISVNGVCLTVVRFDSSSFSVDVMPETFRATNLRRLQKGNRVNLERAMPANGRFGGHIVQGHVDTIGTIMQREREENAVVFFVKPEHSSVMKYMIPKGSVSLDGISLTVVQAQADEGVFSVSIIPHTLAETVLQDKQSGDTVNIESDMLGRYVEHLLNVRMKDSNSPPASAAESGARISSSFLAEHGFM